MSHQNLMGQEQRSQDIWSARFGTTTKLLTSDIELTAVESLKHFYDAGGSNRVIVLPEFTRGLNYEIFNIGDANILTVVDQAATVLAVIYPNHSVQFVSKEDEWFSFGHVFGQPGVGHRPGLVPDPGLVDNVGLDQLYLSENGWTALGSITTDDFFKNFTDGTNTAIPLGADTFKFRSSDSTIIVTVQNNDVTHGDNLNVVVNEAAVDHDQLLNFVADEHVDHTLVEIETSATSGLSGGGTIAATRALQLDINRLTADTPVLADSFAFLDAGGGDTNKATLTTLNSILDHDALVNFVANEHVDHTLVSISAGPGLSGGGTIAASRTISLDITGQDSQTPATLDEFIYWDVSASDFDKCTLAMLNGALDHDSLTGFVANEHIDHTSVTLTAGAGLTGGGTIAASRSFAVGAGTGITVNADDVAVDQSFTPTWTGAHRHSSYIDLDEISVPSNPAANRARFYCKDNGSGVTKLYFRDSAGTETEIGSGGGLSDGDKGDITVASSGASLTIDNNAVTYAKMQDVSATSRILARKTAGAGDVEEATLSEVLDFIGSAARGDILYRGAASWEKLAAGTSGKFLQTKGSSADPIWSYPEIIVKSGSESVNNSTTLQADDHLVIPIAAGESIYFFASIKHVEDGATNADIKIGAGGPVGLADGQIVPLNGLKLNESDTIASSGAFNIDGTNGIPFGASTASRYAHLFGYAQNGGTAGSITIYWAQNTAQTHNMIVQSGSMLVVWRV